MTGFILFFGPGVALLVLGTIAASRSQTKWLGLGLVMAVSTAAWLGYVALVPHVDGGDTVFGTNPLRDDESPFLIYLALTTAACGLAGVRRVGRPLAIGTAATIGPLALAYFTTPQGDQDGLWGLIFIMLPVLGLLYGGVAVAAGALSGSDDDLVTVFARRAAGFGVDAAIIGAAAWIASGAHGAVTVAVFVAGVGLLYLAPLVIWNATIGHRIVGLRVGTVDDDAPIGITRAGARLAIIVGELLVSLFLFGVPALLDLSLAQRKGVSLADKVTGTRVQLRIREELWPRAPV